MFEDNIFNKKYCESYIATTLQVANLLAPNLGAVGARRRHGVGASQKF